MVWWFGDEWAGVIPTMKMFSGSYCRCGGRSRQYSAITPHDPLFPVIRVSPQLSNYYSLSHQ